MQKSLTFQPCKQDNFFKGVVCEKNSLAGREQKVQENYFQAQNRYSKTSDL